MEVEGRPFPMFTLTLLLASPISAISLIIESLAFVASFGWNSRNLRRKSNEFSTSSTVGAKGSWVKVGRVVFPVWWAAAAAGNFTTPILSPCLRSILKSFQSFFNFSFTRDLRSDGGCAFLAFCLLLVCSKPSCWRVFNDVVAVWLLCWWRKIICATHAIH